MRLILRSFFRTVSLLALLLAALPAHAQSIAVVVNGQAITDYDVAQRQKLLSLGKGASRKDALEELVEEQLKFQEAKKLNLSVSDSPTCRRKNSPRPSARAAWK